MNQGDFILSLCICLYAAPPARAKPPPPTPAKARGKAAKRAFQASKALACFSPPRAHFKTGLEARFATVDRVK